MESPFGPETRHSTDPTPEVFTADEQALFRHIDGLQPSGDPVADGRAYEQITNGGHLLHMYKDREAVLGIFVGDREAYQEMLTAGHTGQGRPIALTPFVKEFFGRQIALLDRLLAAYEVSARTTDEYDDQIVSKEGSEEVMRLHAVEHFRPTGDLRNDLMMFCLFTHDSAGYQELVNGADPAAMLQADRAFREWCIHIGMQPQHTAAARFWVTHTAPLEVELLNKILSASNRT